MGWLHWLDHWLASLERTLVVLLLSGLLGLGLLQVIERNVLASGIFWADELLQHIVLWLGFLGASLATREHRHLSIDVLSHFLPTRWQLWFGLLVNTVALRAVYAPRQAAWGLVRSEYTAGTMLTFGVPCPLAQASHRCLG
jgi:TRAP-type C4-dicarboxylate transport system permease small subunit